MSERLAYDANVLERVDLRGNPAVASALPRPVTTDDASVEAVRAIVAEVRDRGDAALRALTQRFDGCAIDELQVPEGDLQAALAATPPDLRAALKVAADRIRAYHDAQAVAADVVVERNGVTVRELVIPVERAGLYVPGGRAAYPSTVLMTAIPAAVAGVRARALCVPPGPDGRIAPATLAAAALTGVEEVYRVGGAQAIAALAYGTESIQPVDVIVGPGNVYVALAKREVAGMVGIDSFAGPSEVLVVADGSVPPSYAAADLLAQAEHGPGGAAVLVTWDPSVADLVDDEVDRLLESATRRDEIRATLRDGGRTLLVDDAAAAAAAVNAIAPEHLELLVDDPQALLPAIRNAGAIFCGAFAPAALGDYVAGANHVLPTARTARFASALRVDTFRKHVHVVDATAQGLRRLAPHIEAIAAAEGLDAHAASVAARAGEPAAVEGSTR